jgi:hypothetical protein
LRGGGRLLAPHERQVSDSARARRHCEMPPRSDTKKSLELTAAMSGVFGKHPSQLARVGFINGSGLRIT